LTTRRYMPRSKKFQDSAFHQNLGTASSPNCQPHPTRVELPRERNLKMSRPVLFPEANTTVAQLIERAKRSDAPVEIRVDDANLVVAVLPQVEMDRLHALRKFENRLPQKPRKTLAQHLAETEQTLRRYEKKYKMSSAEFYRKFQAAEIDEDELDYFDWRVQYNAYKHLKKKIANGKRQTA